MKIKIKSWLGIILKKPAIGLLAIFIASTIVLGSLSIYYFNYQKTNIVKDRLDYLGSTADYNNSQVTRWLNKKYSDSELLRVSVPLFNNVRTGFNSNGNISAGVKSWLELLVENYKYDDVVLADNSGKFVYSVTGSLKISTAADSSFCDTALKTNKVLFSDYEESAIADTTVKFYVPLLDQTNISSKPIGVLVLVFNPHKNFASVINYNPDQSLKLETMLIKTVGDSVVYLASSRFQKDRDGFKLPKSNKALTSATAIKGRRGFTEGIDYKNEEVIAVIQKIPSSSWFLITKINKSEVDAPVESFGKMIFIFAASCDFLFALILYFIWWKYILTEKRKTEKEAARSRDFYLKLLDDFPNPVWRSGIDGKYNYFNKAWLRFTGKTLEQEIGDGWKINLHPEDKEVVTNEYYNAFTQQKSFTFEYRLKDSHGQYKWLINFGMPHYDLDGKFLGYLGSCYDIDDRKKYEETINTLLNISEKLYSSLEIDQISDFLVTESILLTEAESGFACLLIDDELIAKRYFFKDHWEYFDRTFSRSDGIPQRFINSKESYLTSDINEEGLIDSEIAGKYKIRQVLSTPLFDSSGELIGFFELHNKKNNKIFSNDDVNLLRAVARNASISITKSLNYEKLRRTESQLRNSESELRNLAVQIQYAREAERQHIAREVHDELGQLFTGINLNISLLTEILEQNKKTSITEILDELHSVQIFVNKGIQTVRDISGRLRSYVLDHLGIIPAIQEYCREIERISNIKCSFHSDIETYNLDEGRNVALFRIVQEALTNVIRHADATLIEVKVSQDKNRLNIIISDDGKGIPENQTSITNSIGILGMKERAIFLNGELNIESVEGSGTKIHLSIPFE